MIRLLLILTLLAAQNIVFAQKPTSHKTTKTRKKNTDKIQYGTASYYADKFEGRKMANGQLFHQKNLTAAHNSLSFGTYIKVTNQKNGKSVVVRVTDRLHYKNPRLVDLSAAAAKKIGYYKKGLTKVKVEVLGKKKPV